MEKPRKRKRTSKVWQEFTRTDSKTICNICGKVFSLGTSTFSLKYHSESHDIKDSKSEIRVDFEKKHADELLTQFISSHCLPLRLVDGDDFREFINYLCPQYNIPNRQKLSNTLLPAKKEILTLKIKEKLKLINYFSLSIDSWTSNATRSYIAVTGHGINSNTWILETFLLSFTPGSSKEDGKFLADTIRESLESWKISTDSIVSVTSDSAHNMRNAIQQQLKLQWIPCFAHILNLVVRAGLNEVSPLISKCKKISKFFRRSSKAKALLKDKQIALNLPTKNLAVDNKTRWNSCLKMMKRLIKSREAISVSLIRRHFFSHWNIFGKAESSEYSVQIFFFRIFSLK